MSGPLHGYRIVDLSQIVSGPMATLLLSDQGAEVLKVEPVDGQVGPLSPVKGSPPSS